MKAPPLRIVTNCDASELEVFAYREVRKHIRELRNVSQFHLRDPLRFPPGDVRPLERYASFEDVGEAEYRLHERALPRTVRSDERDEIPSIHIEGYALYDCQLPVAGYEILYFEHDR